MPILRWSGIQPIEKRDLAAFEPLVRAVEEAMAASLNPLPDNGPAHMTGRLVTSVLDVLRPAPLTSTAKSSIRG